MADFSGSSRAMRWRLILGFVVTVIIFILLISRLAWIQIVQADELYDQAWEQWNHTIPVRTDRGSVYDVHGRLLAGTTQAQTVAVIPPQIENPEAVAAALAVVLEMSEEEILNLIKLDRSAVYIKRKVDPQVAEAVRDLNIEGIIFFNEEKRDYPGGNLASQLLGFVGMDQGWSGLEVYYEDYLSGIEGRMVYPADSWGRQVPHELSRSSHPQQGYDLYLSLDESIQHIVEKELDKIVELSAPKRAMALAVDPNNGAVLAVSSRPDFNPSSYGQADPDSWALVPFTSSFEPGSTFKLITLAGVIEEGLFDGEEYYHCSGHVTISGRRINCWTADRGGHGDITFYDALGGSCNPAFIELGNRLGKEKLFAYIDAFGFGRKTGIDYPGESSGMVFDPEIIGPMELATTSFGQGISVTPLQQAMAYAAIANGGTLYKPYLVETVKNQDGEVVFKHKAEPVRQVISRDTSATLIELMESVIITGTGTTAALEGYRAAGKTGTAEKIGPDGAYLTDEFIYSFVGFAPVDQPRIVLYVAVDGVTTGPRFGSYTSAPLFKSIMEEALNYLQVAPTELPEDIEQTEE